jgi:isopenicillin-N epimerase
MTERFGRHLLGEWLLDPEITYLNHGTLGATPRRVLQAQQALRDEIERDPARVLYREIAGLVGDGPAGSTRLRAALEVVAEFVRADASDLVFVDNATTGANAVLRSLELREGDEILVTDHAYGGVARAASYAARRAGARVSTVELPHPSAAREEVVERVAAALGPRTRLAVVDHVTSETALVLPLGEIAAACRERGVPVLADGAHAPGMFALDVPALGVDWYAADLHKWAFAPRSCGFLWAAPERQGELHPPVISWGLDEGFFAEFRWVGTRDPTAYLAAPEGIACLRALGEEAVYAHNHELAWRAAGLLAERLGTELNAREETVGAMAVVPLPEALGSTDRDAGRLRDGLRFEDRIEVAVRSRAGRLWARVCAQVYNELADYERLANALERRARARPSAAR